MRTLPVTTFHVSPSAGSNSIGLHVVDINAVDGGRRMRHLEALDNTPILDVKPSLGGNIGER